MSDSIPPANYSGSRGNPILVKTTFNMNDLRLATAKARWNPPDPVKCEEVKANGLLCGRPQKYGAKAKKHVKIGDRWLCNKCVKLLDTRTYNFAVNQGINMQEDLRYQQEFAAQLQQTMYENALVLGDQLEAHTNIVNAELEELAAGAETIQSAVGVNLAQVQSYNDLPALTAPAQQPDAVPVRRRGRPPSPAAQKIANRRRGAAGGAAKKTPPPIPPRPRTNSIIAAPTLAANEVRMDVTHPHDD